ncbi:hypothetical protein NIES4071_67510 [Calothrix sp. NIES-4071]|nr:hypothetical protein NIES4071_67510 [Calothrix sp. NIES-4071]BAZ61029.1 hypothetical protein NIES4105_67470 [Calothrix sp. NIES-4105]
MSRNRKSAKTIRKFYKIICASIAKLKKLLLLLLRTFILAKRKRRSANAGFVLPTVAMVSIVVVLLSVAIVFRSFERSKTASNVRVNEAVIQAATPAIDRARAKLNKLFQDSELPRATPTDTALESALTGTEKINQYTFGDEISLKVSYNGDQIRSAWRYPVDTDNNGKFDSYTLYGIYFKNPPVQNGQYTRGRSPLEARTPPMIGGNVSQSCKDLIGTSASLVGSTGWFNQGGKLKKSFYVYTATVPITDSTVTGNYEPHKGNKGFSAIEYQQDRVQLPLVNNAVVYEDDIALAPGTAINLNGRIITNSNFITGGVNSVPVTLYQVSSKNSCFYEDDNSKIIVGGNLGGGGFTDDGDLGPTVVHLFKGKGIDPETSGTYNIKDNKSVSAAPRDIAYNSLAYVQRITRLVNAQMANATTTDPQEVTIGITNERNKLSGVTLTTEDEQQIRQQQLERYFRRRTRRVPYAEVGFNADALGSYATTSPLEGSGDSLRPIDAWVFPTNPTDGKTVGTNYTKLELRLDGTDKLFPPATEPTKLQIELEGKEQNLGDRALVGNNLPEVWWDSNKNKFVSTAPQDTQNINGFKWHSGDGTRTRRTRIEQLADLGAIERDKDWELAAAKVPANPQDSFGGLRVVTGAGIYLPSSLTLSSTSAQFTAAQGVTNKIWSDMMPVPSATAVNATSVGTKYSYVQFAPATETDPAVRTAIEDNTPYLRMRATAVYHYKKEGYVATNPTPIACVSSYYDPTNSTTVRNRTDLPDVSLRDTNLGASANRNLTGLTNITADTNPGNSNNGVVYGPPTRSISNYQAVLDYQAQLKYPNGRWVNEPLKNALATAADSRTLADKSAIDAAICSLQILDGSISVTENAIPHGAIMERAFLDARQIKAIHADNSATADVLETFTNVNEGANVPNIANYDLSIDQRQPLEIRATVLDVDLLRRKTIGDATNGQEYLVPNSGIIYATRDDALLDLSAARPTTGTNVQKDEAQKRESPVDFKLDPTRRPNAIMLINGDKIWRDSNYRDVEKGFILASNLPVYIKGNFNRHTQQEFTTALQDDWGNFYSRAANNLNPQFACRKDDPRLPNCTTGDEWRPASVLSDAITLLSSNFREGFRNEGDYDLNNNLGNQTSINTFRQNGFLYNSYVTNFEWYGSDGYPKDLEPSLTIQSQTFQGSSYVNNFVTPVQRRAGATNQFNEYLMEVCPKLPISACGDDDWYVKLHPTNISNTSSRKKSWEIQTDGTVNVSTLESGTTASPAAAIYRNFPRRVAFKRLSTPVADAGQLVLTGTGSNLLPVPLGIDGDGKIREYPYDGTGFPRLATNALWFRTTKDSNNPTNDNTSSFDPAGTGAGERTDRLLLANTLTAGTRNNPILVPVLQFNAPFGDPSSYSTDIVGPPNNSTANWLQPAVETTFNVAAAGGDTPARPTEDNGGLHNFVRFLENWNPTGGVGDAIKARISGSLIQIKRSAYASGPFRALLADRYQIAGNQGRAPFYIAPGRQWGYDVGLLSQAPDLFAQKLVKIPDDLPDEFLREVGRDDLWVKTLLCAEQAANSEPAVDASQRPQNCTP